MWSSSLLDSDYNLKLAEELSFFDNWGDWQDFLTTPCINYACNFSTDSFFSLLLFEYSVIVVYLVNVRGSVEILYREVSLVLLKYFSKDPIDFRKLAEARKKSH